MIYSHGDRRVGSSGIYVNGMYNPRFQPQPQPPTPFHPLHRPLTYTLHTLSRNWCAQSRVHTRCAPDVHTLCTHTANTHRCMPPCTQPGPLLYLSCLHITPCAPSGVYQMVPPSPPPFLCATPHMCTHICPTSSTASAWAPRRSCRPPRRRCPRWRRPRSPCCTAWANRGRRCSSSACCR